LSESKPTLQTIAGPVKTRRPLFARIVYLTLALLLLCAAAFFRFRLPQDPLVDPDVAGYLDPALLALTDHGFQHIGGRSFVYPGFVYLVLGTFRDFRAISIVQHLSGLAAGGILLACWNRSLTFILKPVTPTIIGRLLGLLVAALFLFNASVVRLEQTIRPEAIFPAFASLSMFFNIQFICYRFLQRENRAALLFGSITLFNACLLFYLKPSFYLAPIFASSPVWISLLDSKEPLRRKLTMIGIAAVCIAALLFLPEQALQKTDPGSKTFLPTTLFTIHANIIRDQMVLDVENRAKTPYPPEFLEKTANLLDQEIEVSKRTGRYTSLGFDPDYLMYKDSFDRKFSAAFALHDSDSSRVKFYYYYFFRTWAHQPVRMFQKVALQTGILYNNIRKASPYKVENHTQLSAAYAENREIFNAEMASPKIEYEPLKEFISRSILLTSTSYRITQPKAVSWINSFLARTFTLSILLALFLAIVISKKPDLRTNYGWFLATILLFYTYSFANTLGIAIVHTLEITRYLTNQLSYCLLPQCLTLFLSVEVCCSLRTLEPAT
jgi:hypothetical protein